MEVWLHEKNLKQQGGPFQHTAMLWGKSESTLLGQVIYSIFSISIWTTRRGPAAPVRGEMIESPGISVKNREREAPTGPQVNIKTDNCAYLHNITWRQHWTDLERESWNKRVEKNNILNAVQTYDCFNETGSNSKWKLRAQCSQLWWPKDEVQLWLLLLLC